MRYSIFPALSSLTALPISVVTVPDFGLGMSPRGPRILPSFARSFIISGVVTATSNSSQPSDTFFKRSSPPTKSAPASSAFLAKSPLQNTATLAVLPVPCGRLTVPLMGFVAWSSASFIETSTVWSKLVLGAFFKSPTASFRSYCAFLSTSSFNTLLLLDTLVIYMHLNCSLTLYFDPHTAGRSLNYFYGGIHIRRVKIFHFFLGYFLHLFQCNLSHLLCFGIAACLGYPGGSF